MAATKTTITSLNEDEIRIIFEYLWYPAAENPEFRRYWDIPYNPLTKLIPLSRTCKLMRALAAPLIFREIYNRREVWPAALWRYFVKLHLHDGGSHGRYPWSIDWNVFAEALKEMPALRHVEFRLSASVPDTLLYSLVSTASALETLEFRDARFDMTPTLTSAFSRCTSLKKLIMTKGLHRPNNLKAERELENVIDILRAVASQLVHLEISGDFIRFSTFAKIRWPRLRTFVLLDHITPPPHFPLPVVVAQMPLLQTLRLETTASALLLIPEYLNCPPEDECSPYTPLSIVLPDLQSLTISNISPEDMVLDQLPPNLTALRILALRDLEDPIRMQLSIRPKFHPYSFLKREHIGRVLEIISRLLRLAELALTIEDLPSPELVNAIADSCPNLTSLQLEQALYEIKYRDTPYTIESFIVPLQRFSHLRELRISLAYTQIDLDSCAIALQYSHAALLAEKLPKLEVIAFTFYPRWQYMQSMEPRRVIWHELHVSRSLNGIPNIKSSLIFRH